MSGIDSGYYISEIISLGNDLFKITLINNTTNDGFNIKVQDYSTVVDVDLDNMIMVAVDSRLAQLERMSIAETERDTETSNAQTRIGIQAKQSPPTTPVISNPIPSDGAIDVEKDLTILIFNISDVNKDLMLYSIVTTPDIGSTSVTRVLDGTYRMALTKRLAYSTAYQWEVTVTDGKTTPTVEIYTFTTEANVPPVISNPVPADGSTDIEGVLTTLYFNINDDNGDTMDYTVTTTPNIGTGNDMGVSNGQQSIFVSGLSYSTIYQWEVTVDDGINVPVIDSYSFTTEDTPQSPIVIAVSPANGAVDVSISTTILDFTITDSDDGPMDYNVITSPDIGSDLDIGVFNGNYNVAISGLAYSTLYTWTVTADNRITTPTVEVYTFTTEASP